MAYKSPLTREQYDTLKRDQRKLQEIAESIRRAEACGIDCEGQRGATEHLTKALENFEREFFTPPPK